MIFSEQPKETISALGESQLIEQIRQWLGSANPPAPYGIGDDCALLPHPGQDSSLLTTDSLCYGRHFDKETVPEKAGAKLIKRNLSDIAAMGGVPGSAVLALLAGPNLSTSWLKDFFKGIRDTCLEYDVSLVGGDLTQTEASHFSAVLTLTGHTKSPLLRKSADAGQAVYVSGYLGGSLLGKHLNFSPRLEEGQWLAQQSDCTALMDLTDGLAKDLPSLLLNDCSASINLDRIPLAQEAHSIAQETGKTALQHAFTDGEDYELLFAIDEIKSPNDIIERWKTRFPDLLLSRIGSIHKNIGDIQLLDADTEEPLPWQGGYEHFKTR
jgi:thiamine-monophosphate kinase